MPTKPAPYKQVFRFLVDNPEWSPALCSDETGSVYFIGLQHAGGAYISWEVFFEVYGR